MDLTVIAFLALLLAVVILRLVELSLSRRHQKQLEAKGARRVVDPNFRVMVAVHVLVLLGAALEVTLLHRRFFPVLAAVMFALFIAANGVRWWVIRTLGEHWSVQVVDSTELGVVTAGPFRFVRHPNYSAVFIEMLALPLIHSAWIAAILGGAAHLWALWKRVGVEDAVLSANPAYRAAMGGKPRFLPGLF